MNYYKINYDKLLNIRQKKYFLGLMILIMIFTVSIIIISLIEFDSWNDVYGIYSNNRLHIKINKALSDVVKNNKSLVFNQKIVNYKIDKYLNDEIIDNYIYQNIDLIVDNNFAEDEIVLVSFKSKKTLGKYIFELFK